MLCAARQHGSMAALLPHLVFRLSSALGVKYNSSVRVSWHSNSIANAAELRILHHDHKYGRGIPNMMQNPRLDLKMQNNSWARIFHLTIAMEMR